MTKLSAIPPEAILLVVVATATGTVLEDPSIAPLAIVQTLLVALLVMST
jgi:hypothetical protein